jgi:hypothetical protein
MYMALPRQLPGPARGTGEDTAQSIPDARGFFYFAKYPNAPDRSLFYTDNKISNMF